MIASAPVICRSLLLVAFMAGFGVSSARAGAVWVLSEQGLYRAAFESDPTPIPLNRMHSWIVRLESFDGRPIEQAAVAVSGAMPIHDHGLPSAPRMTGELNPGRYLLEGMKFHMSGHWIVVLQISHELGDDRLIFDLEVQ